ncbi:hypothetical protein OG250_19290 [Streptomyces sp. NBC_00487]|uniref:hypothetical protein n=1 Tax=unclassified Streptomyces TaxID=2593676 RepID=UPI002E19251F|nr:MULTISPECIES: hypothetical protein [unclassified Streptomyces]
MPALTADRTPDQLVGETQRFFGVDRPTVGAGVPEDEGKRAHSCAGFGGRPLWSEAGPRVRTALGSHPRPASTAPGQPATRVEHTDPYGNGMWDALPCVNPPTKQVATLDGHDAPATPPQSHPAFAQSRDAGVEVCPNP